uniref:F-ATPase delta subunit n=1 Tax=Plectus sambesii TaxID=2011161 RepID=A0A914X3L9_9BILA
MAAVSRVSRLLPSMGKMLRRGLATDTNTEMKFTFACPASVFYNQANVKQVDVPTFSGTFGILPQHVPTLAVLKPGVLTVFQQDGNSKRYFVSSGSVTVNEDSTVQVLAEEAVLVDDLDASAAQQALQEAQTQANSGSDVEKAEAQIRVEVAEAALRAAQGGV